MAKDDMEVIIYKILRYLYDCNKNGKVPTFSDMFSVIELPMISLSYLGRIVSELIEKGYISGCDVTNTKNGVLFHLAENAGITLDGVNYLHENSRMKKAERIAGKAFEILLNAVISAAFPV